MNRLNLLPFALALCGFASNCFADLTSARNHIEAGEYGQAFATIEKELSGKSPSSEALGIGAYAAWQSGQVISAAKAINAFFQREKKPTPAQYLLGGDIAAFMGDHSLASSRYVIYLNEVEKSGDAKDDEGVSRALEYVISEAPSAEGVQQFLRFRDVSDPAVFPRVLHVFRTLVNEGDGVEALKVAEQMLTFFPGKQHGGWMMDPTLGYFDEVLQKKTLGKERARELLELIAIHHPTAATEYLFSRVLKDREKLGMTPEDALNLYLLHAEKSKKPLPTSFLDQLATVRFIKDDKFHASYVKRLIATRDVYRSSQDPRDLHRFISTVFLCFEARKEVSGSYTEGADDIALLIGKYGKENYRARHLVATYFDRFTSTQNKAVFAKKHLSLLSAFHLRGYLQTAGVKDPLPTIKQWEKSVSKDILLSSRGHLASLYATTGSPEKALAALDRTYRSRGEVDEKELQNIINNKKIDSAKKSALLMSWVKEGGHSYTLGRVGKDLQKHEWGKAVSAENKKAQSGSDPLFSAVVASQRLRRNRKADWQKGFDQLSRKVLGLHKEVVPRPQSIEESALRTLFFNHYDCLKRDKKASTARFGDQWISALSPEDPKSHELLRFLADRKYFTTNKRVGLVLPLLASPEVPESTSRYVMRRIALEKNSSKDPLASLSGASGYPNYIYANIGKFEEQLKSDQALKGFKNACNINAHPYFIQRWLETLRKVAPEKEHAFYQDVIVSYAGWEKVNSIWISENWEAIISSCFSSQFAQAGLDAIVNDLLAHLTVKSEQITAQSLSLISSRAFGLPPEVRTRLAREIKKHAVYGGAFERFAIPLSWQWGKANVDETFVMKSFSQGIVWDSYNALRSLDPEKMGVFLQKLPISSLRIALPALSYSYLNARGHEAQKDLVPLVKALEQAEYYQLAYVWMDRLGKEHTTPSQVAWIVTPIKSKLSRFVPGMLSVEKGHEFYDIYLAEQYVAQGLTTSAWETLSSQVDLYLENWETFRLDTALFVADKLRTTRQYIKAKNFVQTILLKEMSLDAESMAQVNLTKADLYRDMQNYQAARVSYNELVNNERYRKGPVGRKANLRLIDLLVLTKDLTKVEMQAQRLVDSNDFIDQAEGYYYLAQVAEINEDWDEAWKMLEEVFKRNAIHEEAHLMKASLRLKVRGGLSSVEVEIGISQRQETVVPGRELTMRLTDANLAVARGGGWVPVVITTTPGGDSEQVRMMVDADDSSLFKAVIATSIGVIKPGNNILELKGNDVVSYVIDPAFQKDRGLDYKPKILQVRSTGRLIASAGEILSVAEQDQRENAQRVADRSNVSRRDQGRNASTIRPGNPIYVQVTDFDRDISDEPDTLSIEGATSAGDVVRSVILTETGPATGIFRGSIATGIPAPMARASDTREGLDAYGPMNSTRTAPWISRADGIAPKWYEVDMMDSQVVSQVTLTTPQVDNIKRVELVGLLGEQKQSFGTWPPTQVVATGGLKIRAISDVPRERNRRSVHSLLRTNKAQQLAVASPTGLGHRLIEGQKLSLLADGIFWVDEPFNYSFTWLGEVSTTESVYAELTIDDQLLYRGVISPRQKPKPFNIYLDRGIHQMSITYSSKDPSGNLSLGYQTIEGEFVPVPAEWFSAEKHPDIAGLIRPLGKITKTPTGFEATIDSTERTRSLRWIFEEFTGREISVSEISAITRSGEQVIPVTQDFTLQRSNDLLEVAAGDQITVSYEDEKRLEGEPSILISELNAAFYNARVSILFEVAGEGDTLHTYAARRIGAGDQLMVEVTDWDEDLTDENDTVKVTVSTTSGEFLELDLVETAPHSGKFSQIMTCGDMTGGTAIKTSPGDRLLVSYLDSENTDVGVPFERTALVDYLVSDKIASKFYQSTIRNVEDKSEEAKLKIARLRQRGDKRENIILYRRVITAAPVDTLTTANIEAPLLFTVNYPAAAKHEGSTLEFRALAESERLAAEAEGREPQILTWRGPLKSPNSLAGNAGQSITIKQPRSSRGAHSKRPLEAGTFGGILRFQLGKPGDELGSLRVGEDEGNGAALPTLIVRGNDRVTITVVKPGGDGESEVLLERQFGLASDAQIALFDARYISEKKVIHLGQSLFVQLTDADRDTSGERDVVEVTFATTSGDTKRMQLTETLPHSGVFAAQVNPLFVRDKPVSERAGEPDDQVYIDFGDEFSFSFTDERTTTGETLEVSVTGSVHKGANGKLQGFTKKFKDPEIAVRTQFLITEALFEMAKDYRKLKENEKATEKIEEGKRILEEAIRDYPQSSYKAQGEFLLANLSQELGDYDDAITRYGIIISTYPDSVYAPKSQFKKALSLEKAEKLDSATEEYVKLIYLYPNDPLVADATVRLGNYYYKAKKYDTAARIFSQFQAAHQDHKHAVKALLFSGLSYLKLENYARAIEVLTTLIESYPDDTKARPEAMYWKGDAAFSAKDYKLAHQTFTVLTWDYPSHKYAKIARGRLTEGVFERLER